MKALKIIGIILGNVTLPIFLTGIIQFFMLIILGIDFDKELKWGFILIFYIILIIANVPMIGEIRKISN